MSKLHTIVGFKQTNKVVHKLNSKAVSNGSRIVLNRDYQKSTRKNYKRIGKKEQFDIPEQKLLQKMQKFLYQNTTYRGKPRKIVYNKITKEDRMVIVFSIKVTLQYDPPSIWAIKIFDQSDHIVHYEEEKPVETFKVIVGVYDQSKLYCMRTRKFRMPTKYDKVYDPNDLVSIRDSHLCTSCNRWYKSPDSDKCFCGTPLKKIERVCHKDNIQYDDEYLIEKRCLQEIEYQSVAPRRRSSNRRTTDSEFVPQYTTNTVLDHLDIELEDEPPVPLTVQQSAAQNKLDYIWNKNCVLGKTCIIKQYGEYKMSPDPENQQALRSHIYNCTKDPNRNLFDVVVDETESVKTSTISSTDSQPDLYHRDPEKIRNDLVTHDFELSQDEIELLDVPYCTLDCDGKNRFWNLVNKARRNQKQFNVVYKLVQ